MKRSSLRSGTGAFMGRSQRVIEKKENQARELGNKARIDGMLREAQPYVVVPAEEFDSDPLLLCVENGTIQLSESEPDLQPHDYRDRITKMMPVVHDPDARARQFESFLFECLPDPAQRRFLQTFVGYGLTGYTRDQKLLYLIGNGDNGKRTFIESIARVMGAYAASFPISLLMRDHIKRGDPPTPNLARLPGVRLARASEPEKGARLALAVVRHLTSGETIVARPNYGNPFEFIPQFKFLMSGSALPALDARDSSVLRRFLIMPWPVTHSDPDKDLMKKLLAERSGILNWMLEGTTIYLREGLQAPPGVKSLYATEGERRDPISHFLAECTAEAQGERIQASHMYKAYERWCHVNNIRPATVTAFGRALNERGISRQDGGRRYYTDRKFLNHTAQL